MFFLSTGIISAVCMSTGTCAETRERYIVGEYLAYNYIYT